MKLLISPTIQHEWLSRAIGDVIPGLIDYFNSKVISVTQETAQEILEDCEFMMDPHAVDASAGERSAYRALAKQVRSKLTET